MSRKSARSTTVETPPSSAEVMDADAKAAKVEDPAKPTARRGAGSRWTSALTFIGLAATTIAAVYGAAFAVVPSLKPRDKLGATIDHVAVEHGVDNRDYRTRMHMKEDPNEKPRVGDMIFVRVSLTGFKDRSYSIGIQLLDAKGKRTDPMSADSYVGQAVATCEDLSPKANEDGITWRCWAATPSPGTKYRLRVELYDYGLTADIKEGPVTDNPVLLDFQETDLFTSMI